jgi:hypothetical protein
MSSLVLLPVDVRPKVLIEVNDCDLNILWEIFIVKQLNALCLSVHFLESLLKLAVQGPLTEGPYFSEGIFFLNAFEQSQIGHGKPILEPEALNIDKFIHRLYGFFLCPLPGLDKLLCVPELIREIRQSVSRDTSP